MQKFTGFERGMGVGGWLTNYKRFNVLPEEWRKGITIGDREHFATYITEKDVEYIASLGVDHIRLAFDQVVLQEESGAFREEIVALIDRFIDRCEKYGLNVVLNLHKAVGNYCDISENRSLVQDSALQEGFIGFWQAMERRYAAKPGLAFELLNEVRNEPPELWNDLASRTISALRAMNGERKIILGSTCWNDCARLKDLKIFNDENVIYTFHFYAPFEFTHQRGVLQAAPCYYNREMPYPGEIERYRDYRRTVSGEKNAYAGFEKMDERYLRAALAPAIEFKKAHPDKILWCGEFGTIRHVKTEWRENWLRDVIGILKENEIPYCVWNYLSAPYDGNRFSLIDDDTRRILSEKLARIIRGEIGCGE